MGFLYPKAVKPKIFLKGSRWKANPVSTLVENKVELRKSKVGNVDPTYFKSLVGKIGRASCRERVSPYV